MKVVGIIPARLGSTRLPEKMLLDINGKSLIQLTYENALACKRLSDLIVATDDEKIVKHVESFSGNVMMTDSSHASGTDRIAEVARHVPADIYVNIQGDEPQINPVDIDRLADAFMEDDVDIATLSHPISKKEAESPNVVKVVMDKKGFALYFSRALIPYPRDNDSCEFYKHIGIYGYRSDILFKYVSMPCAELENIEKLEQLRALVQGLNIKVIVTEHKTISIDTEEDLEAILNCEF